MPAVPPYIIDPTWQQFAELLPDRKVDHPLGCHHPRIPDRVVFEKLVQVLVFGCAYERIADERCLATTLRRRRDEWTSFGVMEQLQRIALNSYDRMIGLDLSDIAVDGCITKAPCGGEKAGTSPVDRGEQGIKRSMVVDGGGIPLGAIAAPANRRDSLLLDETLDTLKVLGELPERMSVHLDRGYDSKTTREKLELRGFLAEIYKKGQPAPLAATKRWVVQRVPRADHRLLACLLRSNHHRRQAHPEKLDPISLGEPTSPPTISLLAEPLRRKGGLLLPVWRSQ